MAEIRVLSAFVEDVVTDRDGVPFLLRTSEPHRRKDESGEWVTTARTFRTVRASRESGISLTDYVKGDRIEFEGQEKTEKREHDGKTYYDLVVWVSVLARLGGSGGRSQPPAPDEPWATPSGAQTGAQPWADSLGASDADVPF